MAMQRTTFSPRCCCVTLVKKPIGTAFAGDTYRDLEGELLAVVVGMQSIENGWELGRVELDYCEKLEGTIHRGRRCFCVDNWAWYEPSTTAPMTCRICCG